MEAALRAVLGFLAGGANEYALVVLGYFIALLTEQRSEGKASIFTFANLVRSLALSIVFPIDVIVTFVGNRS